MSADAEQSAPGADDVATPPRVIAERYEVRDLIGRGAFGEVFEVYDRRLSRLVALKTMPIGPATDARAADDLQRFYQEAQSVARLSHPGIVTVHDFGEAKDFAWIVMELVIGETLKAVLDRRERPPLAETVRVICALLDALQYAHGRGIVHRDVKPANILLVLSAEDGLGEVRLADFGIARIGDSNQTVVGQMVGTPATMSPEQLRGEQVDRRADLWSVGVILYEMLTGARPFAGGVPTIFHNILTQQPAPPSGAGGVPSGFDAVIATALAKSAADRYPDAMAMADAIRAAAAGVMPEASASALAALPLPGLDASGSPLDDATVKLPSPMALPVASRAAPRSGAGRNLAIGFLLGLLCGGGAVYLWMTQATARAAAIPAAIAAAVAPQDAAADKTEAASPPPVPAVAEAAPEPPKTTPSVQLAADLIAREPPAMAAPAPLPGLPLAPSAPAGSIVPPPPDAPLAAPGLIAVQPPPPPLTTIAPVMRGAPLPAPDLAVTVPAPAPAPAPDAALTPSEPQATRRPLPPAAAIPMEPAPPTVAPAVNEAAAPPPSAPAAPEPAMPAAPAPPAAREAAAPAPAPLAREPAMEVAPASPVAREAAAPAPSAPEPAAQAAPALPATRAAAAPPPSAPAPELATQVAPAPPAASEAAAPPRPAPPASRPALPAAPAPAPQAPGPATAARRPVPPPAAAVVAPAVSAPGAAAAAGRCTPAQVTARSGSHPGFGRIVFQWRVAADYAASQDGTVLQLRFSGPGCLPPVDRLALPRNVLALQPEADGSALRIELAPGTRAEYYRLSAGRIVIDIRDGG
ncbi:MAG TPA: serine/threonine-protein kinase [Roseomonas sp.]|jgi:serine/threonine-protein kinase